MKLHKEGRITIPISILVVSLLIWGGFAINLYLGYIFLVLGSALIALVFNFFRNPSIDIPKDENAILSPCDGKVVVIEEIEDSHFFKGPVTQISVFMSPLNVHVNRNPISGTVRMVQYFPGKISHGI